MKALPPVPVISTSGFDRAVACSDELVGDRCRLRHKIRTHSAGCYGQSQAGQDRPPGSRGDGVSYATDLRVGSGMFVAPPNLRRTLARRRHRVFRAHNGSGLAAETSEYSACDDNVADRGPGATRGLRSGTSPAYDCADGMTYNSHFFIRIAILEMMCTGLPRLV